MLDPTTPAVSRDDAEALVSIMRTANSSKGGVVLRYGDAARAILAAGFRRTSAPRDNAELIAWNRSMAEWERENGSKENAAQHDACAVALSASQPREVEITDDMVERAAEAAYNDAFLSHAPEDVDRWTDLVADNDPAAESWRRVARAALSAALGSGE